MKTSKSIAALFLVFAFSWMSCENNEQVEPQHDLLPESFSVDIPSSISNQNMAAGRISGRTKDNPVSGNEIYLHLGTFIAVGEGAAEMVEEIIGGIRKYRIDRVLSLTFVSDDDHRTKNLVVKSGVEFEGTTWEYMLTTTDADSEGLADGGKAIQIFWNKSTPIEGIAIIKPYNCDRLKNAEAKDAVFRINYSEKGNLGYEAQMEVLVSGLPVASPLANPYAMSTLRMFAGRKGDVVDVYGNSNHPNAILFSGSKGFNWAFVASGSESKDIGVAEVGLPPSALNQSDRTVLLKDNSVKNVFTNQIMAVWPGLDPALVAAYLKNTSAPGYFSKNGFLAGGVSPGTDWDGLAARLPGMTPYNPKEVSELVVKFK